MRINEDIDFSSVNHEDVVDSAINSAVFDHLADKIRKEHKDLGPGILVTLGGTPENAIKFNRKTNQVELLCDICIFGQHAKILPDWFPYVYIHQVEFSGINAFSDIENLPQNCGTVKLSGCYLESLEGMPEHTKNLDIFDCPYLSDLTGISSEITSLTIKHCEKFRSLEGGEQLQLAQLTLSRLSSLHSFYGLTHHVLHITLVNIQIYTPTQVICAYLDLCEYSTIDSRLLSHLPKCRRLILYHSLVRSLEGIDDNIKELIIENDLDCASFILEENLPWNLELLGINLYYTDRNHFNRFNNSFEFPETLLKILLSTHCTNVLKKYIQSKTDALIDTLFPAAIPV